jgi:hypothetical protein
MRRRPAEVLRPDVYCLFAVPFQQELQSGVLAVKAHSLICP